MAGDSIILPRSMLDSDIMQDDWLCRLFLWCALKASHQPRQSKGQTIQPGQFVAGRMAAGEELGVSPSKWYRGIQSLAEMGHLTAEANSKWTTITICNWASYCDGSEPERTAVEQRLNSKRTANEQPEKVQNGQSVGEASATNGHAKQAAPETPEPATEHDPVFLVFPCTGTGAAEWPLRASKLAEYEAAFPGLDVPACCRAALQWCRDNKPRRKTAKGMPAFLTNWLTRQQDRGGTRQDGGGRDLFGGLRAFMEGESNARTA